MSNKGVLLPLELAFYLFFNEYIFFVILTLPGLYLIAWIVLLLCYSSAIFALLIFAS